MTLEELGYNADEDDLDELPEDAEVPVAEVPADVPVYPTGTPQDPEASPEPPGGDPSFFEGALTASQVRTGNAAIEVARLKAVNDVWVPYGTCLQQTRLYYNAPAYYYSAAAGWHGAKYRHPTANMENIPRGVPIWWTGGSEGFGHVAISTGNGYCYTTDYPRAERINKARIADITNAWGLNFQGWTNDINTVVVYSPRERPIIHIHKAQPKKTNLDVLKLKRALRKRGYKGILLTPYFGKGTVEAYKKWQRHLGYRGEAADGSPGRASLHRLGFRVRK